MSITVGDAVGDALHESLQAIHYRACFASGSLMPGAHRSRTLGAGVDVAASVPLARARDWRRLDLHAALRDPLGQWWAREHRQRAHLQVMLLVDGSASMQSRQHAVQSLARSVQHSVLRQGDAFGIAAFGHTLSHDDVAPPSRSRHASDAVLARLASQAGRSAGALPQVAALAPRRSALVFLVSDFLFDLQVLNEALTLLVQHDVVPVWLRQAAPRLRSGLLELHDAESGQWRSLWMRPALAQRWAASQAAHDSAVLACFARHERTPLQLSDRFDADAVNEYFAARG
jgi:hypothetical protein